MKRAISLLPLALTALAQDDVVFRSDVSLVRVDAQVLDSSGRAVTGLRREDFILREEGAEREIRNFAYENMPMDVLVLVDVSTSMRMHVEKVAAASREALMVLGREDRVAMMVFDRQSRIRLPFRAADSQEVRMEFGRLLNQESFSGGTDITRALYDAANYMRRNGRANARRAVVIVTDDQTEFNADEFGVVRAMTQAETVVSLLLAPDAMGMYRGTGGGGGTWPQGGGGGGGGIGGTLGDILLGGGRRNPGGGSGGGYPRGGGGQIPGGRRGAGTTSAGTRQIAARTGGDTFEIDDATALETTLARIRQRYALYFTVPDGVRAGQERNITVELAGSGRRRYPSADVRYRRTYLAPDGSSSISSAPPPPASGGAVEVAAQPPVVNTSTTNEGAPPTIRRRPAVNERNGPSGPAGAASTTTAEPAPQKKGGWRKADPADVPAQTPPQQQYLLDRY